MNKAQVLEAVAYVRQYTDMQPQMAIILGSGLGPFADTLDDRTVIPTEKIPHYPRSTVEGHVGALVFGWHKGIPVLAVKGRTHFYEGYPIEQTTFVVRIMQEFNIPLLLVTNASGSTNLRVPPGSLLLITDQVNFLFQNPLRGKLEFGEPRFPDMSNVYTREYFDLVEQIALERGVALKRGVLWVSTGPSYETAAEIKMIRRFGGDAVSMSTVPEVIAAAHAGMKVIGISCITNYATGILPRKLTHDEVTETANRVNKQFTRLVSGIIESVPLFKITK